MGDLLTIENGQNHKKYIFDGMENSFRYGICSMQGWRDTMEDSVIAETCLGPDQNTHIFGVFDGHGGREISNFITNHFVEEFLKNPNYMKGDIKACLKETFINLDNKLNSLSAMREMTKDHKSFLKEYNLKEELNLSYAKDLNGNFYIEDLGYEKGSTGLICVIHDGIIYFANAGDSRGILIRKDKKFLVLTNDHKPISITEKQRIKKAGCKIIEGRVNGQLDLSRGFGDFRFKLRKDLKPEQQAITVCPEIKMINRDSKDLFIILACDGVWDCVSNEKISQFFYEKVIDDRDKNLSNIIADLFNRIVADSPLKEKGTDNMTCILLQFKKNNNLRK